MNDDEYEYEYEYGNRPPRRTYGDERLYEVTGRKQKTWILGVVLVAVLVGLVYVLSQFG